MITKDDPDAVELSVILLRWEPSTWGQKRHVMGISFARDEVRKRSTSINMKEALEPVMESAKKIWLNRSNKLAREQEAKA